MAGRWPAGTVITYCTGLLPEPYATCFDRAAQQWAAFGILRFERVDQAAGACILPYFVESLPGNEIGLTEEPVSAGPGTTLSSQYTVSPPNGPWTEDEFTECAAHEIGHALGLDHSGDPRSVMTPVINRVVSGPTAIDGATLQAIYPEAQPAPAPADPGAPPAPDPAAAALMKFLIGLPDGSTAILNGQYIPPVQAATAGPPPQGVNIFALPNGGILAFSCQYTRQTLVQQQPPAEAAPAPAPAPSPSSHF